MIATPFAAGALLTSAAPPPPCAVCATLSVGAVNQLGISGAGVVPVAVAALAQVRTRRRFRR